VLFAALPFTFDGVTPTVSKAHAIIGRPLTPGSFAGVHRRAMRRTYGLGWRRGVGRPLARAAVVGAAAAGVGWGAAAGVGAEAGVGAAAGVVGAAATAVSMPPLAQPPV
jgi:hypothetical protein